jgi:hypothetical protein
MTKPALRTNCVMTDSQQKAAVDSGVRVTLSLKHVAPLYVSSADQEPGSGNAISTINHCATFEVLTAVLMKILVSWDVALFRLIDIITDALTL